MVKLDGGRPGDGLAPERIEELESRVLSEMLEQGEGIELVEEIWRLRAAMEEVRRDLGEIMEITQAAEPRRLLAQSLAKIRGMLGIDPA
ncbi:MAG: hypothetical protein M3483_03555 [Gemmatimonadota bacterium]|nr:hypothetical protein [Gemmatimonadota bacterium]MDQ3605823.1 hypothetical protein [Gemmatimonadota bacterium]